MGHDVGNTSPFQFPLQQSSAKTSEIFLVSKRQVPLRRMPEAWAQAFGEIKILQQLPPSAALQSSAVDLLHNEDKQATTMTSKRYLHLT